MYKQMYFFTSSSKKIVDFGVNCCPYNRPENLSSFEENALVDQTSVRLSAEIQSQIDKYKQDLFKTDKSHVFCVHTRVGDFAALGGGTNIKHTEYWIKQIHKRLMGNFENVSMVLLGEDKEFLKTLKYDKRYDFRCC
uniref:Uncharacterized protein n=1 Tax=Ditylenchus dipsaci TaxID=166011 RepID=A0A915DLZ0_9BILA